MSAWLSRLGPWIAEPDNPRPDVAWLPRTSDVVRQALNTGVLLVGYMAAERALIWTCRIESHPASSTSLIAACAAARPARVITVASIAALAITAVPRLRQPWDQFEGGRTLRWLVTLVSVSLAWMGAGHAYNPWLGHPYTIDRLAVAALAALVYVRPMFVPPFLFAFSAVVWQLDAPQLGFGILSAEFRPLANTLAAFTAALVVQALSGRRTATPFIGLAVAIVAANFWIPGFTKLRIDWITHGQIYLLLPNAYTHGWLGFLGPESITAATRWLAAVDWPMRLFTLAVECGALAIFFSRRAAAVLLLLFTVLLIGFFGMLGYFFWKWMLLQLALFVAVFRSKHSTVWQRELFTPARALVSVVVIAGAPWWFAPAPLAWFDTPLADTLRYEATGSSGATYELAPGFFAPYESHIAMGSFMSSLVPSPVIVGPYGATTDRATASTLLRGPTPDGVARLESAASRSWLTGTAIDPAVFDEFIARAVRVSNRRLDASGANTVNSLRWPLAALHPPPFLWTFSRERAYDQREPLTAVHVYRVSALYDGAGYRVFRRQRLRTIPIAP